MYKKESEYSVKTKLRELLLPAYLAGKYKYYINGV